jgi:putative peptide zinc metalloprotease protein
VPQLQAELVRNTTRSIEVRSVENVHHQINAVIRRSVPSATKALPSMALALQGGGEIGLDPNPTEDGSPQTLLPMFQFELALVDAPLPYALGGRVHIRFVHDPMPLAQQWYRQLRELFLKRFDI